MAPPKSKPQKTTKPSKPKPATKPKPSAKPKPSTTTKPKPSSSANKPKPSTSTTKPKPSTSTTKPKPSTSTTKPKPSTSTTKPKPSTSTTKPKPSTTTTKPKPSTTTTKPKPSTSTTKPKPSTSTTKPKPSTTSAPKLFYQRPSTSKTPNHYNTSVRRPYTTTRILSPSTNIVYNYPTTIIRQETTNIIEHCPSNTTSRYSYTSTPEATTFTTSGHSSRAPGHHFNNTQRPPTTNTPQRPPFTTPGFTSSTPPRPSSTIPLRASTPLTHTTTPLEHSSSFQPRSSSNTPPAPFTATPGLSSISIPSGTSNPLTSASLNYGLKVMKILKVSGTRVMHQMFRWGTPDKDPNTDLFTYLNNLPSTSTANYHKVSSRQHSFTSEQEYQISSDTTGETYSSVVLFCVIKVACESMARFNDRAWTTAGPHLEYLLKQIKDEGNKASHSELMMTELEFLEKTAALRQLMLNTLTAVQSRYNPRSSQLNINTLQVNTDIDSVISEPLGIEDTLKLSESEIRHSFIRKVTEHLKELFQTEQPTSSTASSMLSTTDHVPSTLDPSITSTPTVESSIAATRIMDYNLEVMSITEISFRRVMYQVFRWGTPDKGPNTNLFTYLNSLPTTSSANYLTVSTRHRSFNANQEHQILQDTTGEKYDFVLLFRVIQLACENLARLHDPTWHNGHHLEYCLSQMKNKRNETIQNQTNMMTEDEFLDKASTLRQLMLDTLTAAQERYNPGETEVNKEIFQVNADVDQVIKPFSISTTSSNTATSRSTPGPSTSTSSTPEPSSSPSSTPESCSSISSTPELSPSPISTPEPSYSTCSTPEPCPFVSSIPEPSTYTNSTPEPFNSPSSTPETSTYTNNTPEHFNFTSSTPEPSLFPSSTPEPSTFPSSTPELSPSTSSSPEPFNSTSSTPEPSTSTSSTPGTPTASPLGSLSSMSATPGSSFTATIPPGPANIITSSATNRLKFVMILEVCGRRVMYQTFCWGTPNKDPNTDLIIYLDGLPPTSSANYLKIRNKQRKLNNTQQLQISKDTTGKDYDISLFSVVIKIASEDVAMFNDEAWHTEGPDLENLLYMIKQERNEILHEKLEMTKTELLDKASTLRKLLLDTLTAAQQRYRRSDTELNTKTSQVNTDMDRIISEPIGIDEIWKYCEKELLETFLTEADEHLKEMIKKEANMDIMNFLSGKQVRIHVQSIFTEINVVNGSCDSSSIEYTDLLSVFQGGSSQPQVLVVEALAGGGKTTLLKLVIEEWRQGGHGSIKGLHDYQLLLPVECRNCPATSLNDLLEHLLNSASLKYGPLLPRLVKKCCILIIIDGLDERNNNSKQLVCNLLEQFQNSPKITFVCTTRPESLQEFLNHPLLSKYDVKHMQLDGIPVELRTGFVVKYYKEIVSVTSNDQPQASCSDKIKELETLMEKHKDKEHCRLPLILTVITWVFFFDPQKVNETSTQTELLFWAHQLCQDKLHQRLLSDNKAKENVKAWLLEMYLKVLEALHHDQLILTKGAVDHLTSECERLGLPEDEVMSAFLCMKNTWTTLGQHQKHYQAPHKGFQEHYAALNVVRSLENQQQPASLTGNEIQRIIENTCGTDTVNWSKFQNLLQQVAGLLHLHLQPDNPRLEVAGHEVVDLLHKSGVKNVDQWLDILENTKAGESVLLAIAQHFPVAKEITIHDGRVHSYSQLLHHLPPTRLKIDTKSDPTSLVPCISKHTIVVHEDNLLLAADLLLKTAPAQVEIDIMGDPTPLTQSLRDHNCTITIKEPYIEEYSSLLSHISSSHVKVVIKGDNLNFLGHSLQNHDVEELWMLDHYCHPHPSPPPSSTVMESALSRSHLKKFAGPLIMALPTTITHLRVGIRTNLQASFLPTLRNLVNLQQLRVHVSKEVHISEVGCSLPDVSWVELYISHVESHTRPAQLAALLQPPCGYGNLYFPWTHLSVDQWRRVVEGLKETNVRVRGTVYIPSTSTMDEDQEGELASLARVHLTCGFTRDRYGLYRRFEW